MINKDEIIKWVDGLIDLYQQSELMVIWERSGSICEDEDTLKAECEKRKQEIREMLNE